MTDYDKACEDASRAKYPTTSYPSQCAYDDDIVDEHKEQRQAFIAGIKWCRANPGPEVMALRDALKDIMKLIENGELVRDISKDHQDNWALQQLSFVMKLKHADEALAIFDERQAAGGK